MVSCLSLPAHERLEKSAFPLDANMSASEIKTRVLEVAKLSKSNIS